jgi:nudix-type nucleoside diphosphatase (YffH/AdpP family)
LRKVDIQGKRQVFDDIFRIEEATLRYQRFDGTMSSTFRRLNFVRGDSAAAIVLNTDTERVILTDQFRYPAYENGPGWITEIIAGMVDGDDSPEDTIRREILEETGYQTGHLKHITTFYVSPGGTSERVVLFYAEVTNEDKIGKGGGIEVEGEDIQLVEPSLEELRSMMDSGAIADAKTIIGALWLLRERKSQ